MSGMRFGFVGLNPILYKIRLVHSPDCIYCLGVIETFSHYMLSCSRHKLPKIKLFERLNFIEITDDSNTLSLLLSESDFSPGIRRKIMMFLFDYFKDTKKIGIL